MSDVYVNPIVKDISERLNIVGDTNKIDIIIKVLIDTHNNKLAAINAILPGTFSDTSKILSDQEIDDAILQQQIKNKERLKKNIPSFKTNLINTQKQFGLNVFKGAVDSAEHYIKDIGLVPQMDFVKEKDKLEDYETIIEGYMLDDYSDINDLLNGRIKNKSDIPGVEEYCCRYGESTIIDIDIIKKMKRSIYYIKSLFRDVPPIENEIVVYRCWQHGMPEYVEGQPYIYNMFLSTSMNKDYSEEWCMYNGERIEGSFLARITLPAGSRVLPLIDYKKLAHSDLFDTEFELLLNNYGSLIPDAKAGPVGTGIHHFTYVPPTEEFLQERYRIDRQDAQEAGIVVFGGKKKGTKVPLLKSRKKKTKVPLFKSRKKGTLLKSRKKKTKVSLKLKGKQGSH
jgi:hypothetical protein